MTKTQVISSRPAFRFYSLIATGVVIFFLFTYRFVPLPDVDFQVVPKHSISVSNHRSDGVRVAVVNANLWHDEVTASILSAFGQIPECKVDAYLGATRFGIKDVYSQLPGSEQRTIHDKDDLVWTFQEGKQPDIIVTVTTEDDFFKDKTSQVLLGLHANMTETYLFAVFHDADVWGDLKNRLPPLKPWIEKKRMRAFTLASHVGKKLRKIMDDKWSQKVDVSNITIDTIPPVFSVPSAYQAQPQDDLKHFCIQGDLIDKRRHRDFKGTFEHFAAVLNETGPDAPLQLDLIGKSEQVKIPENVRNHTVIHHDLPFMDFYETLHVMTAMLPAFPPNKNLYTDHAASSSIPASLIGGVPLVANQKILDSYHYLSSDCVYFKEEGEHDVDVAVKVADMPYEERERKVQNVHRCREKVVRQNAENMKGWIEETLAKRNATGGWE